MIKHSYISSPKKEDLNIILLCDFLKKMDPNYLLQRLDIPGGQGDADAVDGGLIRSGLFRLVSRLKKRIMKYFYVSYFRVMLSFMNYF